MFEGLEELNNRQKAEAILQANSKGALNSEELDKILQRKVRIEKVAIKDIKLRTFIAEGASRNDLAAHVYDVTYGIVRNGKDTLVVIDDSIVRGTTLKQSIIKMLNRLHPRKIVIVSSSPQVRYPDCYGIDMSRMSEFIAFRAAVELLRERGMEQVLDSTYHNCLEQPDAENWVKAVYAPFTDEEISRKIADMLTPANVEAEVEIIYQTLDGLHQAVPDHPGDWYFSGNYPTPGGVRLVNRAFVNFYEGNTERRD
jgi:amidophosphoribosyltransferase